MNYDIFAKHYQQCGSAAGRLFIKAAGWADYAPGAAIGAGLGGVGGYLMSDDEDKARNAALGALAGAGAGVGGQYAYKQYKQMGNTPSIAPPAKLPAVPEVPVPPVAPSKGTTSGATKTKATPTQGATKPQGAKGEVAPAPKPAASNLPPRIDPEAKAKVEAGRQAELAAINAPVTTPETGLEAPAVPEPGMATPRISPEARVQVEEEAKYNREMAQYEKLKAAHDQAVAHRRATLVQDIINERARNANMGTNAQGMTKDVASGKSAPTLSSAQNFAEDYIQRSVTDPVQLGMRVAREGTNAISRGTLKALLAILNPAADVGDSMTRGAINAAGELRRRSVNADEKLKDWAGALTGSSPTSIGSPAALPAELPPLPAPPKKPASMQ